MGEKSMVMTWKDYVVKSACMAHSEKVAQSGVDVGTVASSALGGSGIGALIGWKIAEKRRKNKVRGMLLGQLAGGLAASAASAYGPLLFR